MKQSIHLLDPVANQTIYKTMRCGYLRNPEWVKYTDQPAEVTCIKCRSYINNPWRMLRKYGQVKVVEDMFVMLWGQYGYQFDISAMTDVPGTWSIIVSYRGQLHLNLTTQAGNTAQLGFKLVDIIEAEIIKLKSPFNSPFVKGDEEPESRIQQQVSSNQQQTNVTL